MKRILILLTALYSLVACQPRVIELTGVLLSKHELKMEKGQNEILKVLFIPTNATYKSLTWVSTNTAVATVSDGIVTSVAPGTTDIIAKSGNCSDRCVVTVLSHTTGITIDKHEITVELGESATLSATLTPDDSTDPIEWSSSDERIVTVKNGTIKAIAPGSALITAMSGDQKDMCQVTSIAVMKAIDLGLSVKWGSFNLGASKPEEHGDYFAWGETEPHYLEGHSRDIPCSSWRDGKTGYDWESYKWSEDYNRLTKYCWWSNFGHEGFTDEKTVLDPDDDAAHINLGGNWRMPTSAEWAELSTMCTWTITTNYKKSGVNGVIVTSNVEGYKDKSIFLPGGSFRDLTSIYGGVKDTFEGYYWSSSLAKTEPLYALMVCFYYSGTYYLREQKRYCGLSIRPVSD